LLPTGKQWGMIFGGEFLRIRRNNFSQKKKRYY